MERPLGPAFPGTPLETPPRLLPERSRAGSLRSGPAQREAGSEEGAYSAWGTKPKVPARPRPHPATSGGQVPAWPGLARFHGTEAHGTTTKDVGPTGSPSWGPGTLASGARGSRPATEASGDTERPVQAALSPPGGIQEAGPAPAPQTCPLPSPHFCPPTSEVWLPQRRAQVPPGQAARRLGRRDTWTVLPARAERPSVAGRLSHRFRI